MDRKLLRDPLRHIHKPSCKGNSGVGLHKAGVAVSFKNMYKFISCNKMKKLLIILLFYYPIHAYTQGWAIDYSVGYGTYQLDDVKSLLHSIPNNYGLKETDCFPNYITHSVMLGYDTGRSYFGANYSYLTTGGRLNRADYLGSYTVDMIMNGNRLGAFYRYSLTTGFSPVHIYLQLSSGVLFSSLKMNEQVIIYSESDHEAIQLTGVGIYAEPTIGATYRFKNYLYFSLGGGYEADFLGTLKLSGQETQIKAHWNGFRFYGGLTFILPTKKTAL